MKRNLQTVSFATQKGFRNTTGVRTEKVYGGARKKSFNITALKEWEEAGEPFEEDDEILAYLEYKKYEA
ncbi:hypothetical protein C1646_752199 [Rhizophagus diaphanus]|nr:hypothetical protein C1646_752199 [Rhizophagus diaphanus] [Rhizophagus sp. MUCL 43196]